MTAHHPTMIFKLIWNLKKTCSNQNEYAHAPHIHISGDVNPFFLLSAGDLNSFCDKSVIQ